MPLSRHLNKEAIGHADADSPIHAKHVRQRRQMNGVEWIAETVATENAAVEFKLNADGLDLGQGAYWIGVDITEKSAPGKEFQAHCNSINWERRWNYAEMTRKGKKCKVRRKRNTPACEEFVVNFAPWQMRFINGELTRWEAAGISAKKRKEMLVALVDEIRRDVVADFKARTGRNCVASYIHFDSNKIHIGIVHSRIDPENDLVGEKRLGTVGPWSTAQNRIAKLGLVDDGDSRLDENLEKFRSRFGEDRQPLDIALHDLMDDRFAKKVKKMGADAVKRYEESQTYYKEWKQKIRRDAAFRTAGSQRIAWQTLRLITPILPPQLRAALSIARTCVQAFQVIGAALDAVSSPAVTPPSKSPQPELTKTR
jgi:hypothetical protein